HHVVRTLPARLRHPDRRGGVGTHRGGHRAARCLHRVRDSPLNRDPHWRNADAAQGSAKLTVLSWRTALGAIAAPLAACTARDAPVRAADTTPVADHAPA